MNYNNKLKIGLALASIISAATFCGCKSVQTDTVAQAAELAAYTGASIDLQANPSHAAYYNAAIASLDALVLTNNYDPNAFVAALQQLPIKELKGSTARITINAAEILWDNYKGTIIPADEQAKVQPILLAVRSGLARAVGDSTPPPKPSTNAPPISATGLRFYPQRL